MTDSQSENQSNQSNLGAIVAIVAGIIIIIAGIIVYNYFSNAPGSIPEDETAETVFDVDEEGEKTDQDKDFNGIEFDQQEQAQTPEVSPSTIPGWTANNYQYGDISGDSYTVVSGDTLWEISEAVYGSGAQWQQIAGANSVGYLANGNPLILPGQVLTLP